MQGFIDQNQVQNKHRQASLLLFRISLLFEPTKLRECECDIDNYKTIQDNL